MLQYSPRIIQDGLTMCLDASQNTSLPTIDLPVKDGLVMWMDASDDSTFSYSSGTTVSQWRDKSGLNNHVAQSTVANQPSRSSTLNSRKNITFDGTNDSLSSSNSLDLSVTHTIFAIGSQTVGTSDAGLVSINNSLNNGLTLHNGATYYSYFGDGAKYATASITTSTSYIFTKVFKGSSSTTRQIYLNGNSTTTTGTITNSDSSGVIRLGQQSSYLNGTISEVIIFNRELSVTELKKVHTYLGIKWGISNTDRSVIDISGNNNNGLLGNGTVANMPVIDYYNKGSFVFDGSNDYIVVPNASSIKNPSSITIDAWVNISNPMNYYGAIVGKGTSDADEEYTLCVYTGNNRIYFDVGNGAGPYTDIGYTFSLNTWYHIAATHLRSGGSSDLKIYVNGSVLSGTVINATNSPNDNSSNVTIGSRFTTPSSTTVWNGKIASVKIYNRTLSAAEILQNYNAQKSRFDNTIVQYGLVLNLDAGNPYSYAGAGTTWYDTTTNANNATLINSPTYSTDNNGMFTWTAASSQYATVPMNSGLRATYLTQEVWVYLNSTAAQVFIGAQFGSSSNNSYALWVDSGLFNFGVNTAGTFYYTTSSAPTTGVWYHLVHTYNGSVQYLYINGVLTTTYYSSASGSIVYDVNNTKLAIAADFNGGYDSGAGVFVNGKMPIVRIYNRALSAAEVLQNYNAVKSRFGL